MTALGHTASVIRRSAWWFLALVVLGGAFACSDGGDLERRLTSVEERVDGLEFLAPPIDLEIQSAVRQLYEFMSDAAWSDVWFSYSSEYRERCSFDDLVANFEDDSGVRGWRVSQFRFFGIDYVTSEGSIGYTVERLDEAARTIDAYDYVIYVVRDGDKWVFTESCFPHAS